MLSRAPRSGTFPAGFIAPCLPTFAPQPPSGALWVHEIKHDGFRVMARKEGTRVRLYSRPGNDLTHRFPLIVGALGVLGLPFPYEPQQVTLLNLLTIGIPAFVITLSRERSTAATKSRFVQEVGWFALRTGVVIGLAGLGMVLISRRVLGEDEKLQRTLLLSTLILLGITALLRVLTDGEARPLVGDTKFRWLAVGALPVYLAAMYLSWPAYFFELVPLGLAEWGLVLAVAVPGFLLCKLTDRLRLKME